MWTNLWSGIRGLFGKRRAEREMDDELRDFLEKSSAEKMRAGMTREEAYRRARMEFGGMEAVKEKVRSASWETHIETLWSDLRFGARLLRFNKVFACAAILSLALGIGANAAIFQLLDAVRLRTLPVKNPQEIARIAIDQRHGASGDFTSRYSDLTYAMWVDIRAQQQAFSSVFAWSPTQFNIAPSGEVHNVEGLWVSGEFFETLGVEAVLGRVFTPADDHPGCASSGVVISYSFWQHEYAGEHSVIGRTLTLDRQPFEIIGVTPPSFQGVEVGRYFDVAVPLCAEPIISGEDSLVKNRSGWWLASMGRLKPGWSIERASAQLRAISPALFEDTLPTDYNPDNTKQFLQFKLGAFSGGSGVSQLRTDYEQPLWLLLALAGAVLLIASANLANLLLARASAREKEMGMRMAVGASRARLVRQLLAESLLLAVIGATLGAFLARNLGQVLVASLSTQHDPLFIDLGTDWRVLGFTTALAALTCLLFGLAPALRATSVSPIEVLKEGARGTTGSRARFGLRRILVVAQIALSLALLVGALLFTRSLSKLDGVDAGFRRSGILVTDIDFSTLKLNNERNLSFAEELLKHVRAIPGVNGAAIAEIVPLSGNGIIHDILMGVSSPPTDHNPYSAFNRVSPGYFETMQTPMIGGRDFDEHDVAGSPLVAIINETFARKIVKTGNPIGAMFRVRRLGTITGPYEIIGLVKDTKYQDLHEEPQEIAYTPIAQYAHAETDAQILIRSNMPLAGLIAAVKDVANEANPGMDVSFTVLHQMIEEGLLRDRLMARLSGFFGALAVLLAVIGLYGVISYMVARRRNEIGIRMSLGAGGWSIVRLVLRESLLLLAVGLTLGIGLALAASQAAASLLFGLKPYDATTLAMATAILAGIALAASYIPAVRASRLDPLEALRHE
ncbi:MAG: ABC transporter permease [Candidatus Acidiferrum sp.]|jgi:putative ABC transport system permease protein